MGDLQIPPCCAALEQLSMIRAFLALLAVLALATPAAAGPAYKRYVNARFGVTADRPADWTPGAEPENGDGLKFTSPDGKAVVTISGSLHAFDSVKEYLDIVAEEKGAAVTLEKRGSRSLVQSGRRGDMIFYKKSLLTCKDQVWNNLVIEYPAARKAEFDALAAHVAGSLRGGRGYQVKCG